MLLGMRKVTIANAPIVQESDDAMVSLPVIVPTRTSATRARPATRLVRIFPCAALPEGIRYGCHAAKLYVMGMRSIFQPRRDLVRVRVKEWRKHQQYAWQDKLRERRRQLWKDSSLRMASHLPRLPQLISAHSDCVYTQGKEMAEEQGRSEDGKNGNETNGRLIAPDEPSREDPQA